MRFIRAHAQDRGIDKSKIGIMGFSAGGELVTLIAFDDFRGQDKAKDVIERKPAHPNFLIQIYPGPLGTPKEIEKGAIPAFLLVSNGDACCSDPVIELLKAYHKAGAPVEVHIYDKGDHGFNMGDRSEFITIRTWPDRLADWLRDYNFFAPIRK